MKEVFARGNVPAQVLGLCLVFLLSADAFILRAAARSSGERLTAEEETVRKRVEEFYGLLQLGQWSRAEEYLTEDSIENFRNRSKNPFLGFQVDSIRIEADGEHAVVVVNIKYLGGLPPNLFEVPKTTRWQKTRGVWHAVIPNLDPNAMQSLFSIQSGASAPPRRPEPLKFKGHRYRFGEIQSGQVKVARFPFTNVTSDVVKITKVLTGCDCLTTSLEKQEYRPGESGELVVKFDSSGYQFDYAQTIVVKINQAHATIYLTVEASITPRHTQAPESKPGRGEATDPLAIKD